jgi:hypothetical protein
MWVAGGNSRQVFLKTIVNLKNDRENEDPWSSYEMAHGTGGFAGCGSGARDAA